MDRVGKQFAKIGKDIAIAVKAGGPSPTAPGAAPRAAERACPQHAQGRGRAAIKKASGQSAASYDIIIYEGYAPHGIALLVEAATDNVTRTVANVRHAFKHHGGNMGTTAASRSCSSATACSAVARGIDRDSLELELIDHGLLALEDGESDKGEKQLIVRCAFPDFGAMHTALESRGVATISTEFEYVAPTLTELPDDKADEVMHLVARSRATTTSRTSTVTSPDAARHTIHHQPAPAAARQPGQPGRTSSMQGSAEDSGDRRAVAGASRAQQQAAAAHVAATDEGLGEQQPVAEHVEQAVQVLARAMLPSSTTRSAGQCARTSTASRTTGSANARLSTSISPIARSMSPIHESRGARRPRPGAITSVRTPATLAVQTSARS